MLYNKLKKIIFHPVSTFKLINRRHFQLGYKNLDPEAKFMKSWIYGKLKRVDVREIFPGIEKVDYTIVNGLNRTHNMSITLLELNTIVAIEKFIKARNVLEIGTYDGGTTINLAANLEEAGMVYSLDLPKDFKGFSLNISSFNDNKIDNTTVGLQYKNTKYENNVKQIYADSGTYDYEKLKTKFDLFFIDGCHDYEYVKKDTEQALKYTKKGGIIIWHDYSMIEDVANYLDELSAEIKIYAISGTRLAVAINK